MIMEEKNKIIEEYLKKVSKQIKKQFGFEIINKDVIDQILTKFKNSPDDLEDEIIPRINEIIENVVSDYFDIIRRIRKVSSVSYNPEQLNSKLESKNQGIYISSLMGTALSLINCSSIEEINNWIDTVPNLYMTAPFQSGDYSKEQIEAIKKELFEIYQDSMISTEAIKEIRSGDKEETMRYQLHKKLNGLNISMEEELRLGDIGLSQGLAALYEEIKKICIEKYGEEKGKAIWHKILYYFPDDYENFNSTTYEQIQALDQEIKSNIKNCNEAGGDFQFVIASLSYGNTVMDLGKGIFEYGIDSSKMGQELADRLGASYRLRSMINRNTADEMVSKGFTKDDKEIVIQILRDSLTQSLSNFNSSIENDGKNRTFELFNELVEIQKADRNYNCVWEDRFGITIEDLIEQIVMPNMELIEELKGKNVDFMYNETLLQESPEKRKKVMETMIELQKRAPGLITVFGDQNHTFSSDYSKERIDQLREAAEFDKQMAKMVFGKDKTGKDIKVKIECSERDLHLSQRETEDLRQKGFSREDILKYKQSLMDTNSEIYRGVPFQRECEWTVVDNLSGEFYNKKMDTKKEAYLGKYTKISEMARKDNSQRVNNDLADFNSWKKTKNQFIQQSQVQYTQSRINPPFAERSQEEIRIHNQIKEKNQKIKQQKVQKKQENKPKVKTLSNKPNNSSTGNRGFANTIILSLIVSFACGALVMALYMLLKG